MSAVTLSPEWSIIFADSGARFAAKIELDTDHGAPWDEEDGHGPVSEWTSRDKSPGELVLAEDGRRRRYYDFAEACKIARRDGWDAPPYGTGTRRQRASRAARADFDRLRAYCNGDWGYVGVIVAAVCDCCGTVNRDNQASLWGIESDAKEYLETVAFELLAELDPAEIAAA